MKSYVRIWSHLAEFFLEWEMFHTKFIEQIKTHTHKHTYLCSEAFSENLAVYQIMWESKTAPYRSQITIWFMRIACWITKATDTKSEYILIIVFPLQQLFRERASILRNVYIACLFLVLSNPTQTNHSIIVKQANNRIYRVIHKSLRDFRTRLRNNQDRHGRKEHINR